MPSGAHSRPLTMLPVSRGSGIFAPATFWVYPHCCYVGGQGACHGHVPLAHT